MRKAHRFVGVLAVAFASFLGVSAVPSEANAAPGTCKCNSGCHANPGQCVKGAACNVGYAPTCGYRSGSSSCPMVGYISCDGTCTCTPIPGFCDTIGGAEYCDAGTDTGVPDTFVPDTYVPDTFVPDTYVPDTFVPDTYVPDTFVPDTYVEDTYVPDTFVPDTYVEDTYVPDTYVPDTYVPDTYVEDTYSPPVDSCVPLECLPGTKTIVLPGECDPFCAPPAGGGEFKCNSYPGTVPVDGYCIPKCLTAAFACGDCKRCSLGDGTCFDDITACDGGVPDGWEGGTGDDTGGSTDGTVDETPISFDTGGSGDDATTGDSSAVTDTSGDPFGPPPAGDALTETQGGCGCSVPGNTSDNTVAAIAAAAALALVFARRRRDD